MNAWHIASLVFTLISLLLLLIALCSDYWAENGPSHSGIWKLCVEHPGLVIVCASWGMDVGGYLHATRAFLILGVLAGVVSTGLLCALFFRSEVGSYSIIKIAYSFNFSAGMFALLAMAIFTGVEGASSFYSWSFGLGWACGPLFLIAGSPHLNSENASPFLAMNALHIAAMVCTTFTCIILIVALRTRHWVDSALSHSGLWDFCFKTIIGTSCIVYGWDKPVHVHVTAAFLSFAIISSGIAFFLLGISFFRTQFGPYFLAKIAAIANFVAGGFVLISVATFTGGEVPNRFFGWSFGLAWACLPLCITSGGLAFKIPTNTIA